MKMLKRLRVISVSTVLVVFLSLLSSCSPTDNLGSDIYSWSIYPSKTSTYDLGSYFYRWLGGYFHNIDIGNSLTIGGVVFTSANISGSGNITAVTGTAPITSTGGATPDIGIDYDNTIFQIVGGNLTIIDGTYVPYVGATDNVNLGVYSLLTTGISGFTAYGDIATDRWTFDESNTFVGERVVSQGDLLGGQHNTGIGHHVLPFIVGGDYNTAIGSHSMFRLKGGSNNVAVGTQAGGMIVEGISNVMIGAGAGATSDSSNGLWIDKHETDTPLIGGNFTEHHVTINGELFVTEDLDVTGNATVDGSVFADTVNITGTVWKDLRTPVNNVRVPTVKYPAWTAFRGSQVLAFADQAVAGNEEEVYLALQMPHDYKEGTDLYVHPHFVYSANQTGTKVRWGLSYSWANLDDEFPVETTIYKNSVLTTNDAYDHRLSSFAPIDGTGKKLSSMLLLRLFRNSSSGDDDYTDEVYLLEIDAHYVIDALGSAQELIK